MFNRKGKPQTAEQIEAWLISEKGYSPKAARETALLRVQREQSEKSK